MGQRLEICITTEHEELANAYYHWSAYTSSAMEMARQIVFQCLNKKVRSKDKLKNAIRLLEFTGAGMTVEEKKYLKLGSRFKNFKFKKCFGRNEGLIAVTAEGRQETRNWQEGQVFIDIEGKMIQFDVWCRYTEDELKEDYPDKEIKPIELDFAPDEWMSFEQFLDFDYQQGAWYKYGDLYYRGIE